MPVNTSECAPVCLDTMAAPIHGKKKKQGKSMEMCSDNMAFLGSAVLSKPSCVNPTTTHQYHARAGDESDVYVMNWMGSAAITWYF